MREEALCLTQGGQQEEDDGDDDGSGALLRASTPLTPRQLQDVHDQGQS